MEGVKFAFGNYCGRGEKRICSRKVLVSAPLTIHIDLNQVKLDPNFEYKARSFLHTIPTFIRSIGLMMTIIKGKTQKFKFQIDSQINLRSF